jgi:hypothetical protein
VCVCICLCVYLLEGWGVKGVRGLCVRTLLSSRTVFIFSIHTASTGPSNIIHFLSGLVSGMGMGLIGVCVCLIGVCGFNRCFSIDLVGLIGVLIGVLV